MAPALLWFLFLNPKLLRRRRVVDFSYPGKPLQQWVSCLDRHSIWCSMVRKMCPQLKLPLQDLPGFLGIAGGRRYPGDCKLLVARFPQYRYFVCLSYVQSKVIQHV